MSTFYIGLTVLRQDLILIWVKWLRLLGHSAKTEMGFLSLNNLSKNLIEKEI